MDNYTLQHAVDSFSTLHTARKIGLGLAFLKMLAEQTGGQVEIASSLEKEPA